jgi:hypothetical protein
MILFCRSSNARRGIAFHRSRNSGIGVLFHRSQFDWPEHLLCPLLGHFMQPALNFFPPIALWLALPFQELDAGGRRRSQDARHLYFTDHTFTGNKNLFALGTGSHQRSESSLAAPSQNLFHRLHFDWCRGTLPFAWYPSRGRASVLRTKHTNLFLPIAL